MVVLVNECGAVQLMESEMAADPNSGSLQGVPQQSPSTGSHHHPTGNPTEGT